MNKEDALTAERLREVLDYDAETGIFTRRMKTNINTVVGQVVGSLHHKGYLRMSVDGHIYWAHRLAWLYVYGEWPKGPIDHANRIRTDNRICNLREASYAENNRNVSISKTNKSGAKGVSWDKSNNKWRANVVLKRKNHSAGLFDSVADAAKAAQALRAKLHGEFATDGLPQANSQEAE